MRLKKTHKTNPQNVEEIKKYYLIPEYAGELNINELAEAISKECTLSTTDTKAVLEALTQKLPWYLQKGFIIQLGALGRLRLSVSSDGQTDEKDLTADKVTKTRLIFTPSSALKKELEHTTFSVV